MAAIWCVVVVFFSWEIHITSYERSLAAQQILYRRSTTLKMPRGWFHIMQWSAKVSESYTQELVVLVIPNMDFITIVNIY